MGYNLDSQCLTEIWHGRSMPRAQPGKELDQSVSYVAEFSVVLIQFDSSWNQKSWAAQLCDKVHWQRWMNHQRLIQSNRGLFQSLSEEMYNVYSDISNIVYIYTYMYIYIYIRTDIWVFICHIAVVKLSFCCYYVFVTLPYLFIWILPIVFLHVCHVFVEQELVTFRLFSVWLSSKHANQCLRQHPLHIPQNCQWFPCIMHWYLALVHNPKRRLCASPVANKLFSRAIMMSLEPSQIATAIGKRVLLLSAA